MREIRSWIEIAFDNIGIGQLFVNFPDLSLPNLNKSITEIDQMSVTQVEAFVANEFLTALKPIFENEHAFLMNLSDCLKRTVSGESLSDSQKYLIRFDQPFQSHHNPSEEGEEVDLLEIQSQINPVEHLSQS